MKGGAGWGDMGHGDWATQKQGLARGQKHQSYHLEIPRGPHGRDGF